MKLTGVLQFKIVIKINWGVVMYKSTVEGGRIEGIVEHLRCPRAASSVRQQFCYPPQRRLLRRQPLRLLRCSAGSSMLP